MSKKIQAKLGRYFSGDSVTNVNPVSISCVQDNNNVLSSPSLSVSDNTADSATEPASNLYMSRILYNTAMYNDYESFIDNM
jgi:hypothetical protein